jgi:hypothetical protein
MPNHLSDQDLSRYRSRTMPHRELLAADDHLASCDICYGRFDDNYLEEDYKRWRRNLEASEDAGSKDILPRSPRLLEVTLAALSRNTGFRPAIRLAGAALITGLVVWMVTLPARNSFHQSIKTIEDHGRAMKGMQAELDALRQRNETLENELRESRNDVTNLQTLIAKDRSASLPGPKDSSAGTILSLNDGPRLVRIESNGTVLGLKPLSRADERLVSLVLTTGNLKTPAGMAELRGDSRSFMGSGGDSGQHPLLTPVGAVVESDSPTFRWRPLDGTTAYTVGVYDSELNKIAVSEPLRDTEWKIPQSLKRGEIYTWQVRARLGSQEIILPAVELPDAKFKVLERSWLRRLERARRAAGDSHLVLGILYARAGLLGEAERELKAAALANPQSLLAERLLNSVKDLKER